ncbi:MAG: ABC transporter permease subunit [Bacteroidota bacterium]|nr:ABC transporter permease subunit [Bacteroidota bacterium]
MFPKRLNLIVYALLFFFAVLPLVCGLGFAILYSFGIVGVLNNGFTLQHWFNVFAEGNVVHSFLYSALIAIVAVSISVTLALLTALVHHKAFTNSFFSYIIYIPLAFPGIVAAFFFFQFLSKAGVVSRILYQIHVINSIDQFPDLVNDSFGIGMIVAHVFLSFPFFVLLFVNLIETERIADYQQLASTLSASKWQNFFRVSAPLLLQKALPNIILYFIFIFGAFEVPLLLGRSNPETVSVLAARKLQRFDLLDIPQGYAVAVLYTIFVFTLLVFMFKIKKTDEV